MKALYLLNIAPVVALSLAWGIEAVASRGGIWRIATAVVVVEAVVISTIFVLLGVT